jgi:hypothetical protein
MGCLSCEDIAFLNKKGCFQLPQNLLLNGFVRKYFLYVHPFLPFLDEGTFWDIYCQRQSAKLNNETIPLLILQANLFASCSVNPFILNSI